MRLLVGVVLAFIASSSCTPKEDVTPVITISPGAKERIAVMDRFRHHGAPRRWLPRVTVEEVDDAEIPPVPDEDTSPADDSTARDAGDASGE